MNKIQYTFLLPLMAAVLFGCNTTQFLDKTKEEQYLVKNVIKFNESKGKIKGKTNLTAELSKLFSQTPNRKMFGVPRQYFYFASQDTFDRSKVGMAFMRWMSSRGEIPSLLDTNLANSTAEAMRSYLISRGYFYADVTHSVHTNKKKTKATVTYLVDPDSRFYIDSLQFQCKDTAVERILREIAPFSLLKPGKPVDVKLYDQEVARITRYMRNNGYAFFIPKYISKLEGFDSSNVKKTVSIRVKVLTPPGTDFHQKYTVGNIYVFPNYDPSQEGVIPDTLIDGLFFARSNQRFRVKPRTLASSIYFRSGEVYSLEAVDNSMRQLGSMSAFKPPTLRTPIDTLHPDRLDFFIYLTWNAEWDIGYETSLNSTERTGLLGNANLIGFTFNPSLHNRNLLNGAELFSSSLNFGAEFNFFGAKEDIVNSLDFRWQNDLYFPRFQDYFGIWNKLHKWHLTGSKFHQNLTQKATSRASGSYNVLKLLGNYTLQFVNLSYGYEVPVSINHRVSLNHFGIDLVLPDIKGGSIIDELIKKIPSLNASFSKQFITGLLLRDINFVYQSPPKPSGKSWFFRGYYDMSGLEVMALNGIYNWFASPDKIFRVNELDFSHYAKLELDGRRYWQFSTNRTLIARLNAGIAAPYYKSTTVPYIKQFFAGGPYGIRGWYTRELGPGLFKDPSTEDPSNRNLFYQAGDIKLEFNLEYRFLLSRPFGFFNMYGAFFIDGGNIWTLDYDTSRIGSRFTLQRKVEEGKILEDAFYKTMGLSAGFGVRMDFSYFVIRLDLGTPFKNNYPDQTRGNSYWIDKKTWEFETTKGFFGKFNQNIRYQLAIGYPF